jgi:hypothetical protein
MSYWRVGPLEIWLQRTKREWRIGTRSNGDPGDSSLIVQQAADDPGLDRNTIEWLRVGFRGTRDTIELAPALAPRPLVVRPDIPFNLPQKEETTLFISSPLWIRIKLGQPGVDVLDIPVYQPSDTWFGPSTIEGELCFALRTRARLNMEQLDTVSHRVFSAIQIKNMGISILDLERLKLPMPNLSLFAAKDGRLWTETIKLNRREDGDLAELRLDKKPPAQVQPAELVSGPRGKAEKGVLIRAFGDLLP